MTPETTASFNDSHVWLMGLAYEEAIKAYHEREVPVGAVIKGPNGEVLAMGRNTKEDKKNPFGHAEINVMEKACAELKSWRLEDCSIYVTLEPCVMCLGAMIQARIKNLYFGAYDPKGGAISLGYHFYKDSRLNHRFSVTGGVMHYPCSKILSDFFRERRKGYLKL